MSEHDPAGRIETRARLRLTRDQREAASIAAWEASEEHRDIAARKKAFFHEFEEHPHEWYMDRVYLWLVLLAAIGLVGAVAWMVA